MSYIPTLKDIIYLTKKQPQNFADPLKTRAEAKASVKRDFPLHQKILARELYSDFRKNGGQNLKKSPVPAPAPAKSPTMDSQQGAACVECQAAAPCCFTSGSVLDASDKTRKLTWPPEGGPTRMLTIAKDVKGAYLVSKIIVEWEGKACQRGTVDKPAISATGLLDKQSLLVKKKTEVMTGYLQIPSTVLMLGKFLPEDTLWAFYVVDATVTIVSSLGNRNASFTPDQCSSDGAMLTPLQVSFLPYAKLEGSFELAVRISFTTGGISASVEVKGSLEGQYGGYKFNIKNSKEVKNNTGGKLDSENDAPGLIGMIGQVIGTLDQYISGDTGTQKPKKLDRTKFSSGVTLNKILSFKAKGLETKAKKSSPDAELKVGLFESTLGIGVSGKLDFIDLLAIAFTGPGANAIREARARMASGKAFKGTLEAYLMLGADGKFIHSIDSSTIIIFADDRKNKKEKLTQKFSGEFKITGKAEVKIQIGAKVWCFEGSTGAQGSVHTSWTWMMRMQDDKQQKKYKFEGVVLTLEAYASVKIDNDKASVSQSLFSSKASSKTQASDFFEQVREEIDQSNVTAEQMAQQQASAPEQQGTQYSIWKPKETEWVDY